MVESFASTITLPASLKGSLLIEDYITLDRTKRECTKILWEISNDYKNLRNTLLSITNLMENLTSESTNKSEALMAECLLRVAESIDHSLYNFSIWENSSYYLSMDHSERPYENFMSRMAHDILRKRNEMAGFSASFWRQIEHIENSAVSAGYCNGMSTEYVMNTITKPLQECKLIMQHITTKYMSLQSDVSQNHAHLRLSSIRNYTTEEYVTWVDFPLSRRCINLALWSFWFSCMFYYDLANFAW